MNAVYWGVTALCIMNYKEALNADETIEYVMSCWDDEADARPVPLRERQLADTDTKWRFRRTSEA
jgi:prenyltransferase beta subunit